MGTDDNTESRIEAAIARMQTAANAILESRAQGSLDVGDGDTNALLKQENEALRWELDEMAKKYAALKEKTDIVSNRLDNSIGQLSMILEQ